MSYGASDGLQRAIYARLSGDAALTALVGSGVFDAEDLPSSTNPAETYVVIGAERVRDNGSATHAGAVHDFTVAVHSVAEGFSKAKQVAAAVGEALTGSALSVADANLICLRFVSARAERTRLPQRRRITMRFQALLEPTTP